MVAYGMSNGTIRNWEEGSGGRRERGGALCARGPAAQRVQDEDG